MSLVHEALQKAEREKQRKTGTAPISTSTPISKPAPSEPRLPAPIASTAITKETVAATATKPSPAAMPQRQQTIMPVVIACVAVVAIVAIVYLVSQATSTIRQSNKIVSASANNPQPTPASQPAAKPAVSAPIDEPAPVAEAPAPESTGFKLTGIMPDFQGKNAAVLNGRVVYEGYTVDGATVKKIERNSVVLEIAGRETVLRLE